jgi:glutamate dehydrogenase
MDSLERHVQALKESHRWLLENMPKELIRQSNEDLLLEIAHHVVDLPKQEYFILLHLKQLTLAITLHDAHVDLKVLEKTNYLGVYSYNSYVSKQPLEKEHKRLYVAVLHHLPHVESQEPLSVAQKDLLSSVLAHYPELGKEQQKDLHHRLSADLLQGMTQEFCEELFHLIGRSVIRDHLQYYLSDDLHLIFSWKNVPKNHFLENFSRLCKRYNLSIDRFKAHFIRLDQNEELLLMDVQLNKGSSTFDRESFIQELCFLKFGSFNDAFDVRFIGAHLLSGHETQLLKAMGHFAHQFLVYADSDVYSKPHVFEAIVRHFDLCVEVVKLFQMKFDPANRKYEQYDTTKQHLLHEIQKIDTGNAALDTRRKNVLKSLILFTEYCLKTNFYRENKSAISFRVDPTILNFTPYDRSTKFPEIPFGIFFVTNKNFVGFHIRFKDLSRGGLRTVSLNKEQTSWEINNVFFECYNLAYTQQKKNKDIPEGGSKAIIFCDIHNLMHEEMEYVQRSRAKLSAEDMNKFQNDFRWKMIYESQRAFIHSFLTLINCHEDGELKAKNVIDYYKKPEYIYLGPDENMHNSMIEWIAQTSEKVGYKPKKAFISSKPDLGINHKEFGITSYGVHTCMKVVMEKIGIDPNDQPFSIKISGGPDGDVAGNEIMYLIEEFPKTARIVAITDGTGTIRDDKGLDHKALKTLFEQGQGIKFYPTQALNEGGFLLDITKRKEVGGIKDFQLLTTKENHKIVETFIPASEASQIFRLNLLKVEADIFIPAGGRPRTLNQNNVQDFLNVHLQPTAKAIIEGANLYLTAEARHFLEEKGVIIIKDSSANKGGVVCSSFEVLCGLILQDEEFLENKRQIVDEILEFIRSIALKETNLILKTHDDFNIEYAKASDLIAEKINMYSYQILDHLISIELSNSPSDPLNRCLLAHCLPILRQHTQRVLKNIPDIHKKSIIASFIGANTVYEKGISWEPSVGQILPELIRNLLSD